MENMENVEVENQTEVTHGSGILRLVRLFTLLILLYLPGVFITTEWRDFEKELAKEYSLPLSVVEDFLDYNVHNTFTLLPYPHEEWYVTLENGSDVTVATAYFGKISIDKTVFERYFPLQKLSRELRNSGYPY